jgi:hypothetical protein
VLTRYPVVPLVWFPVTLKELNVPSEPIAVAKYAVPDWPAEAE